jgi:glutathione S-transferase
VFELCSGKDPVVITVYGLKAFLPPLKGRIRDIRTLWALEELEVPYTHKKLDAQRREHKQASFLALNPFGRVPAIQDGDVTLFESSAICTYLAEKHGKLIPASGSPQRREYDQWMAFTISTLEPLCTRVVGIDFFESDKSPALMKYRNESLESVAKLLQVLDQRFEGQSYVLSGAFSMVDVLLCSVLQLLSHTPVMERFPHVQAYLTRACERPAFARALEGHG